MGCSMRTRFDRAFVRLTSEQERQVLALFDRFEEGLMSEDRLAVEVAALVGVSKARAASFADVAVAAALGTAVLGMPPQQYDPSRVVRAVRTLMDAEPSTVESLVESRQARLSRMVRSETAKTVQDGMQTAHRANGVQKWVRETDDEPCPLCEQLADNVPRSVDIRMSRHEGCVCWPRAIQTSPRESWGNTGWANVNPAIREQWSGAIPA